MRLWRCIPKEAESRLKSLYVAKVTCRGIVATVITLAPVLTPHGRLALAHEEDAPALAPDVCNRLQESFARGHGHGLLRLGGAEMRTVLPPLFVYWREFAARYVTAVCTLPNVEDGRPLPQIPRRQSMNSSRSPSPRRR